MRPYFILFALSLWQTLLFSQATKIEGIETETIRLGTGESNGRLRMQLHPYDKGGDVLTIQAADPSVVISLVLPGGRLITRPAADRNGFEWEISKPQSWEDFAVPNPFPNTVLHMIRFPPNQPSGEYEIRVDSSQFTEGSALTATFVGGSTASDYFGVGEMHIEATHNKLLYAQGERPVVRIEVRDGLRPVNPASVNGSLYQARSRQKVGTGVPLAFVKNQDSYTATLAALPVGEYLVEWSTAGKRTSGEAFSEKGSFQFAVGSVRAEIISFSEQGVDLDRDGRFEEIDVIVKVRIPVPGQYMLVILVAGDVYLDANDKAERGEFRGHLDVGETTLKLKLNGQRLAQTGAGPYRIVSANLQSVFPVDVPPTKRNPRFTLAVKRSQLP